MKTYKMGFTASIMGTTSGEVSLDIKGDEPDDEELDKLYEMAQEKAHDTSCASLDIDVYLGEEP